MAQATGCQASLDPEEGCSRSRQAINLPDQRYRSRRRVPLHSHAERETFYVLEGEIEGLCEDRWGTLRIGDTFDVPSGLKHA
jgi:mannose-6-phosphate isomerase-like protein (cupin superfamily)